MTTKTYELISDLYKDAYGFRPSSSWLHLFNSSSDEVKSRTYDDLVNIVLLEITRENERQKRASAKLAKRLAEMPQTTLALKIAALHDEHGTNGWDEALEYALGVPFGHLKTLSDGGGK